jgi:rhomboid protease GluP
MISKETLLAFLSKGFRYTQSNIKGVTLLYRATDEKADVCALVDEPFSSTLKAEDYEELSFQVERKLLLSGFRDVETMFFIFSENPEKIRNFTSHNIKFWILDMLTKRVIIYENQPEDYYLLRKDLENLLLLPAGKKEKIVDKIPIVTLSLVIVNVIVFFVAILTDFEKVIYAGASYWGYIFHDLQFYRLLTSMFLHTGITHLTNNVIILILAGNQLEAALGKWKYMLVYFVSGIGSGLVSALYYMFNQQATLSVGASGAIYGVIGALSAVIIKTRKGLNRLLGVQFFVMIAFILYDGFSRTSVDFMAHLGGFLIGLAFGFIFYKTRINVYKVS